MGEHDNGTQKSTTELYSRNWAFISPELQQTLDRTCVFAAGVGLTSTIAVLACRTGFGAFILADGDQVEVSNLNRQAFFRRQIGENKAVATAELLRDIRPDVNVTVLPEFIEGDSYLASLDRADVIINSIDYDNPALFALARDARARGIPMIVPLNLGWGGAVTIFTADSMSLEEFMGVREADAPSGADVSSGIVNRALMSAPGGVPGYLAETLADFQVNGAEWVYEPQLGPTAALTAAMVVRAATALAAGEPVLVAPAVFHVDLRTQLDPTTATGAAPSTAATAVSSPENGQHIATTTDQPATPVEADAPIAPTPAVTQAAVTHRASAGSASRTVQKIPGLKKADDDFRIYLRTRQQNARYPVLTTMAAKGKNLIYQRNRPSGLWVYAIRHDMLSDEALGELGEFRIDQYALAGLYDTTKIALHGYRTDPSLMSVSGNTIHLLCGTHGGQLLSCCSIVPARGQLYSEPTGLLVKRRQPLVLADDERAVFPTETELFGRGVFESLPAIQEMPVDRMRELVRMLRNQAINSPLTSLAVFEIAFAVTEVLTDPKQGIDIALGNAGPEARNMMEIINIPLLYAPWASVVVTETIPEEDFWSPPPKAERYFWPFVLPSADLRAITPLRQQLDKALGSSAQNARNALVQVANLARQPGQPQAPFITQAQMPPRWFASPPYGPPIPSLGQPDQS